MNHTKARMGFTMIELLASMAILIVITLFVGRIFGDTSKLWKLGNRRVANAMDGRTAIDFMVREMSATIADDVLVMAHDVNADANILGMDSDRIYFASADQRANWESTTDIKRQVKMVSYHIATMLDLNNAPIPGRYRLVRNTRNNAIGAGNDFRCYVDPNWWSASSMNEDFESGSSATLAENVRTIEFWVYDRNGQLIAGNDYNSKDQGPPGWIEIYLEMLSEDDAIKAALLSGSAANDYADRASRRYVGRVFLNNGRGYAPDT